jgi:hypothetical protein
MFENIHLWKFIGAEYFCQSENKFFSSQVALQLVALLSHKAKLVHLRSWNAKEADQHLPEKSLESREPQTVPPSKSDAPVAYVRFSRYAPHRLYSARFKK